MRGGRGVALGAAAFAVLAAGCHEFYQVRGTVRSCHDQKPIPSARVELSYPGERGANTADERGDFIVAVNDIPGENPATLRASAPGHRRAERTVHHSYERRQDICLEPEKSQP